MYQRVLAAVNEFINSELAARYAIALAKTCKAKLFLVFVAEDRIDKDAFGHAESALGRLFIEAQDQGIEVERVTEKGSPLRTISAIVKKEQVDILFAATRREDVSKRFFQRTLAKDFMLRLPCSVAMVRVVRMGKSYPKQILVPLKGRMTHLEERACFVAGLAEVFDSSVTLFHLSSPMTSFFHGGIQLPPSGREGEIPRDIEDFTECLHKYKISHEKKTGYGSVSRSITIEAAHRRNDLIVMGASERSLLRSIVSGNPVEQVLRETPCNLIILRPRLSSS
jgi:nucleotide-binding universal stress UspA family protein